MLEVVKLKRTDMICSISDAAPDSRPRKSIKRQSVYVAAAHMGNPVKLRPTPASVLALWLTWRLNQRVEDCLLAHTGSLSLLSLIDFQNK